MGFWHIDMDVCSTVYDTAPYENLIIVVVITELGTKLIVIIQQHYI